MARPKLTIEDLTQNWAKMRLVVALHAKGNVSDDEAHHHCDMCLETIIYCRSIEFIDNDEYFLLLCVMRRIIEEGEVPFYEN